MSVNDTKMNPDDPVLAAELQAAAMMPDADIDLSDPDAPETLDWTGAVRGRFYAMANAPEHLRVDDDVLRYFKASGPDYQARINRTLRAVMLREQRRTAAHARQG